MTIIENINRSEDNTTNIKSEASNSCQPSLCYRIPLNEDYPQAVIDFDDFSSKSSIDLELLKERKEWQNMLSSVLTGEVMESEKSRINKTLSATQKSAGSYQLWLSLRASLNFRSVQEERRWLDGQKLQFSNNVFENVLKFRIKDNSSLADCIDLVVETISKVDYLESLYPTLRIMKLENPVYAKLEFQANLDALTSWCTLYKSLKMQMEILKKWTVTEDLNLFLPSIKKLDKLQVISEETLKTELLNSTGNTFTERMLKDSNLQRTFEKRTLTVLNNLVIKVKQCFIMNLNIFKKMNLPMHFDETETLVSFPKNLIQQCLKLRLSYSEKLEQPSDYMINQMIEDFKASLSLACKIKQDYDLIVEPVKGWNINQNLTDGEYLGILFRSVKFYFKLLNWKLNTISSTTAAKIVHIHETEVLDSEWMFFKDLINRVPLIQTEVSKQFCSLTSRLIHKLQRSFDYQINSKKAVEITKETLPVYNIKLENSRLRSRRLMRFANLMFDKFENAAEYCMTSHSEITVVSSLLIDTHFLVRCKHLEDKNVFLFASHDLFGDNMEQNINIILKTCYNSYNKDKHNSPNLETASILLINTKLMFIWEGQVVDNIKIEYSINHLKQNHIRIVCQFSEKLSLLKQKFLEVMQDANIMIVETKLANHTQINDKLFSIKKQCFLLCKSITQNVDILKTLFKNNSNQLVAEIIQNCYSFSAEFCQKVVKILDTYHMYKLNAIMIRLSIDWVRFVCNDCDSSDRKTFRWTVIALEFVMNTIQGNNILSLSEYEFDCLRCNVAGCMTLLISHFDIQGARGTHEIKFRKDIRKSQKIDPITINPVQILKSHSISTNIITQDEREPQTRDKLLEKLEDLETKLANKNYIRKNVGKVLDNEIPENKGLLFLASGNSNISIRWQQGKFLGAGTFGSVYLAVNLDSGDLMAVKEFKFLDTAQLVSLYKSIKEEMSVMEIMNHPNIVSYYGIEVHRDKVYLFMEYCEGGTLAKLLEQGGIKDEDVIRIYTCQMLRGLSYLHENNILHRDIKPDNILLDHKGIVKFVDFGAAKIAKDLKTYNNTIKNKQKSVKNKAKDSLVGTPMYMAPEVITGKDEGCKGAQDIWSLGCSVLEMVTGKRPWHNLDNEWAIMYHIVTGHPPLPDISQISEDGLDFLKQCFSPKPYLRPTAKALLEHRWFLGVENIEQSLTITNINGNNITTIKEQLPSTFSFESSNNHDESINTNSNLDKHVET